MLSFINYLLMLEAKVDDLASKYPEHSDAIHKYNSADPTPTKKFLPWLVKQHISGHVTPEDARLHSTLKNFDKVKHGLTTKDHTGYKHFNDLADSVEKHVKSKMEQEGKKNATETIHTEPKTGITVHHIKTKEASQKLYGGGNERGGEKGCARGTSWCVSARSNDNLFHDYGHMYTIHNPHDDNAPYAVHPFNHGGTVTSRHNDGDNPHDIAVKRNPKIKKAVDAIMNHSAKHIDKDLNDKDAIVRETAVSHPKATPEHIAKALNDRSHHVRAAAAGHANATTAHIDRALSDANSHVRYSAVKNPKASVAHIDRAVKDEHEAVRMGAIQNPKATSKHIDRALDDEDVSVRASAIRHPKASSEQIDKGLSDESTAVRMGAAEHPNATPDHIDKAQKDSDYIVRRQAIRHPNASTKHIDRALKDGDVGVRYYAVKHPNATDAHISKGLKDPERMVSDEARYAKAKRDQQ